MPHALVLVMLVQTGDVNDPSVDAAVESIMRAVGSESVVRVKPYEHVPADGDIAQEPADAAVVLTWTEDHRHAHLHFLRIADGTWVERDIGFDPRDAAKERGRTIGFALASMLPDTDVRFPKEGPPSAPPTPPAPSASGIGTGAGPPPEPPLPAQLPIVPQPYNGAISAFGLGAVGVGGDGGGYGGGLAFEWYGGRRWGFRASFSARASEIAQASATAYVIGGGVGVRARVWERGPFELGLRGEAVLLWHELSHLDADDPTGPAHQSRFLPGVIAAADFGWFFTSTAALVLGVGTEVTFGQTEVFLHGADVATLVPVRAIGELGFRVRF